MEHSILAPHDGAVEQVRYRVGDQVEEGATLVSLREADSDEQSARSRSREGRGGEGES